jgi:hypothetical protein
MSQRILLTLPNYQSIKPQCLKLRQWDTFKMSEYLHWFPWIKKVSFLSEEMFKEFLYLLFIGRCKCLYPNYASNILLTLPNY